jgi:hypothetical protein
LRHGADRRLRFRIGSVIGNDYPQRDRLSRILRRDGFQRFGDRRPTIGANANINCESMREVCGTIPISAVTST